MIIFRKPEEYKRFKSGSGGGGAGGGKKGLLAGGHMVLINLKEDDETLVGIEYKGKRLGQICFQLPSYGATAITAANDDDDDDDDKLIRLSPTESQWKAGLLSAFGKNNTIDNNDNNNDNNNDDGNDNRLKDSIIWVHSKMDNEKDEHGVRATRQLGSGVLDLCYVASGRMDVGLLCGTRYCIRGRVRNDAP